MPQVVVGARTDVGRHRSLNEDALLVGERVWVVADGMGGHAAGDVASSLAVQSLRELDAGDDLAPATITEAVDRANAALVEHGRQHPEARGMGTTVTGLAEVRVGGEWHWAVFNVGDSRVYRYAGGALRRVTVDHSEVEELLTRGLIDAAEARIHPARHIITRSVGMRPPPTVDLWLLPQTPGERFVLCSDGLNSELSDERIAAVLAEHPDADAAASALVDAVLATDARDNVSVLVVDVVGAEAAAGDELTVRRMVPTQAVQEGER
ncbi:PP2C family protein-serine/threonine phosphatase [Micropruina sp.]|uniref:PP2C family protein-serine/threonine phosphatase n=1 Tax=Micropruina sp. TaxID=2737536 RepID=UPI0039E716EF